ncbi:cyclic nucleotide-binding domain-containing protein [Candidatus Gracilibacteria bacterium]|nr:cyclic nucleotide-binding domain-containing protein [Candidatus Gracilibacteria bacterium]
MLENIYNLEIFKGIDKSVIDSIILECEERKYSAGEMIIIEGEESNGEGYILKKGKVAIGIGGAKIAELNEGTIFGEIALLNEDERTATVTAITDIEVIVLSLNNLINMINNDDDSINRTIMNRIEENISRQ